MRHIGAKTGHYGWYLGHIGCFSAIKAEKKRDTADNTDRVHRAERSFGALERRFNLSNGIDVDGIEASQTDGVLTVVLPKSERAKSRDIEVK